ncbi:MAG TPA: carboxypeptidase regulatory-like domain-containing protein, partial [Planctomycetota bacterium]|nr:carboxypeptidase regulatory-like domain-containing protein [Planctomycetota bacterium]
AVSVRRAVAIEGTIVGLASRPLPGAVVRIRPRGDDKDAYGPVIAGAGGAFKLPLLYADQPYELDVAAAGHATRVLVVKPGEVKLPVTIPLSVAP